MHAVRAGGLESGERAGPGWGCVPVPPHVRPPLRPRCHRSQAFNKSKLRWKYIATHFGKHKKECRSQYTQITGKPAPVEDDD